MSPEAGTNAAFKTAPVLRIQLHKEKEREKHNNLHKTLPFLHSRPPFRTNKLFSHRHSLAAIAYVVVILAFAAEAEGRRERERERAKAIHYGGHKAVGRSV
jgi:hypothetical protein